VNGWTVDLHPIAEKELQALDEGPKAAAFELIADLRELGPVLVPSIRIRAYHATWRARFHHDRYRMVYQVSPTRKRIFVTRIKPRPTAYDGMKH
jgi:mRNA-degrading endonuclease RelE of RelBE toxin-antitoxin system